MLLNRSRNILSHVLGLGTAMGCVFFIRTGPEVLDLGPPEPAKEKEKQGFFRAIKKKKKKTQAVSVICLPCDVLRVVR